MKTTLIIPDHLMRELKEEAARSGRTMSDLVEGALRNFLNQKKSIEIVSEPLPTFKGGTPRVEISNREALYDILDQS